MNEEITIGAGNILPCLHCGKLIDLNGDIHLCKKPKGEWLKKQRSAKIYLKDDKKFDVRHKKLES